MVENNAESLYSGIVLLSFSLSVELLHNALPLSSRYSSDTCLTGANGDLLITKRSSGDTDDVII